MQVLSKYFSLFAILRGLAILAIVVSPSIAGRLPVKIYTSADGLGSGFVDYLYRDSRGFMWFCTRDGLSRFDGSRFVTFKVGDQNAPPGIENIFETREGTYFVTTTGGTYKFDPNSMSNPVDGAPGLNAEFVTGWRGDLIQDRNGTVWMGSGDLLKLEKQDGKDVFVPVDLALPARPDVSFVIYELAQAVDGSLWFHSTWGLIRWLPDGRRIYYPLTAPSQAARLQ